MVRLASVCNNKIGDDGIKYIPSLQKQLSILFLLLLLGTAYVRADESLQSGLHCGQIITLTATPDAGYRFVSWSDGDATNPRRVEVTQALELQALFELSCSAQYILPVEFLFGQMYVLNRNSLKELGYTPAEQQVRWYRVVGEIDEPSQGAGDDMLIGYGYYMLRDGLSNGEYYAQYTLDTGDEDTCADVLRSCVFRISATGLTDAEGGNLRLVPNLVSAGGVLTLTGMPITEKAMVRVTDMSGRVLQQWQSDATATMTLTAQAAAGCYLINVQTSKLNQTLIYIVH